MQPQFTRVEEPTLLCNHSYRRKASDRTMVANLTNVSALLVSEQTGFVANEQ